MKVESELRPSSAIIHPTSFIDPGVSIGPDTRVWHFCHVLTGTTIGGRVSIGQNCMIGPNVRVGSGCKIQNNVSIYEGVELEDDVFCGPSCVFTNVLTPRAHISRKAEFKRTRVGKGATIGANATIVCGVSIGAFALVGAGSVVTRDVRAYSLVFGAPARHRAWVGRSGERLDERLICPRSGERYRLDADGNLEPISGKPAC